MLRMLYYLLNAVTNFFTKLNQISKAIVLEKHFFDLSHKYYFRMNKNIDITVGNIKKQGNITYRFLN